MYNFIISGMHKLQICPYKLDLLDVRAHWSYDVLLILLD